MPRKPRICDVPDCSAKHTAHGLCAGHGYRWKQAGKPPLAEFIADQAGKPLIANHRLRRMEPEAAAQVAAELPPSLPAAQPPQPVMIAGAFPGGETVDLGGRVDSIVIGMIGDYITIALPNGRVVWQTQVVA